MFNFWKRNGRISEIYVGVNPLKPVLCKGRGKNDDKNFENKKEPCRNDHPARQWRRSRDLNPGGTHAPYSLSRGAPSATWVLLHGGRFVFPSLSGWIKWRRERDSNPRCLSASLVFKTSAFNRSAISPCCGTSESYYNSFLPARQSSFFKKYGFLGNSFCQ